MANVFRWKKEVVDVLWKSRHNLASLLPEIHMAATRLDLKKVQQKEEVRRSS
jgi:hypothetical protein